MAVGQNLRYLFGVGYHPTIVFLKGFLGVHRGTGVLTHGHIGGRKPRMSGVHLLIQNYFVFVFQSSKLSFLCGYCLGSFGNLCFFFFRWSFNISKKGPFEMLSC